jgi:hypothetical protein
MEAMSHARRALHAMAKKRRPTHAHDGSDHTILARTLP